MRKYMISDDELKTVFGKIKESEVVFDADPAKELSEIGTILNENADFKKIRDWFD